MSMPRFKVRKTEDPDQDPHWQDVMFPTSWQHLRSASHKRDPLRQVSASHDKSPPRTTSLGLARQVSTSHELPPTPTEAWAMTHDASLGHERLHHDAWGNDSPRHAKAPWRPMQAAGPDKSLNAGLPGRRAIPSTSSPTLPHASFARGTQAPPTTSSGLGLGLSVAG
jgi:hypothetical protein